MTDETSVIDRLVDAALPHVAFEGWSPATYTRAVKDSGVDPAQAAMAAPRGALDLAVAYHRRADRRMAERLAREDLSALRFRDRVARALEYRIEAMDNREAVRRAASLFALPNHAGEGARLVWQTADTVWTALGDDARDANWYSKRATLSGVWASTLLFWLGDDSPGHVETRAFIARRIDDVMRFEKAKARLRETPVLGGILRGIEGMGARVRAPRDRGRDLPGGPLA